MSNQEPRQERSRRRREALLRAAIDVLADAGARSVTHRAVAARAGLPLAATTYYFASVDELIDEALKLHVSERVAELQSLLAQVAAGGRSAHEVAERLAAVLVSRPPEVLVGQYQLYLEAARNPALRPAVAEALAAFERLAATGLAALGARHPEEGAGALVALLDGFALHRVARPRPAEVEAQALFNAMRALFLEQVMEPTLLARLHQELLRPLAEPWDPAGAGRDRV